LIRRWRSLSLRQETTRARRKVPRALEVHCYGWQLGSFNWDYLRLRFLTLRQCHRQHAVGVLRFRLAAVDAIGKHEGPAVHTVGPLGVQIVLTLLLLLRFPLRLDGQGVALKLHLDVLRRMARQVYFDLNLAIGLDNVGSGCERRPLAAQC